MKLKKINLNGENILWLLFLIIFSYAVLVVGSPINFQPRIMYAMVNIYFIITIVYFCIKKQKLKITKIDILVFILTLSTFLPIIFKTATNFESTINGIVKYLCIFELYICFKLIPKTKKKKNSFEILIIVLAIVLIIFGMDMLTGNNFEWLYKKLDKVITSDNFTNRIVSLFEYPNVFALFVSTAFIITLKRFCENKTYIFTNICLFIELFAIIASESRFIMLLTAIITIIYLIIQRKKGETIDRFIKLFIFGLAALIYYKLFKNYIQGGKIYLVYVMLIAFGGIITLISFVINLKKSKKIVYIIFGVIIIGTIIISIIDISTYTQLELHNNSSKSTDKIIRNIYNIQPDKEYEFKFVIDAHIDGEENNEEKIFKNYVVLFDSKNNVISRKAMFFNNFEGEKTIKVTTTNETEYISIVLRYKDEEKRSKYLKLKEFYMNGEKMSLDYKIVPWELIQRVRNLTLNTKSVSERFAMLPDSYKLIKNHWFVGQGENTWNLLSNNIKSFGYSAKYLHSFPANLWLESGIIALLAYILIVALLIIKLIKKLINKDKKNIEIFLAIVLIVIHSIFDFDMEFISALFTFFILIALADDDSKEVFSLSINKIVTGILTIISTILLMFNIGDYIARGILDENYISKIEQEEQVSVLKTKTVLSPFSYDYKLKYCQMLEEYRISNDVEKNAEFLNEEINNLEYIVKNEYAVCEDLVYRMLANCYLDKAKLEGKSLKEIEELNVKYDEFIKFINKNENSNDITKSNYDELCKRLEEIKQN